MRKHGGTEFFRLIIAGCLFCAGTASAQTNFWTNSVSGYWEQPFWSSGALPGTNQAIVFTNAWQALAIGAGTVADHPETLQVEGVTLAAPSNSFNELLLNYAGLDAPLVIGRDSAAGSNAFLGRLVVETNSAVVILSSALQVNNASSDVWTERGAFSVGGTVNHGDFGKVTAGFLRVGDIGPGVYNLTNGLVSVSNEYVGENFPAVFNQFGGSNQAALEVDANGEYDLYAGNFGGSATLMTTYWSGGTFRQLGGAFSGDLIFLNGSYLLQGGDLTTSALQIPAQNGPTYQFSGSLLQSGGTNLCQSLQVWGYSYREGPSWLGSYILSNGVLFVSGQVSLNGYGSFTQSGGFQTNSGLGVVATGGYSVAAVPSFSLSGGVMATPDLFVQGNFAQSGGTNLISGDLYFSGMRIPIEFPQGNYNLVGSFSFSGGLLSCSNATVVTDSAGTFSQSAGILQVSNLLSISGRFSVGGYRLSGGQINTRDLSLSEGGTFRHTGGIVINSGLITFSDGTWIANTNETDLGRLVLNTGASNTISHLFCPSGASVLRFRDSSSIAWASGATLMIEGWIGSPTGGGHHQIFFGNNSAALTAQQLGQIRFHNPAGLNGISPAAILPTGEIVPALLLSSQRVSGGLVFSWAPGATLQTATNVLGPYSDLAQGGSYTNHFTDSRRFFRLRN